MRTTTAVITHNVAIAAIANRVVRLRSGEIVDFVRTLPRHLLVPASALFRRGQDCSVFVVENGRAGVRSVEIGHRNALEAELVKGLGEGVEVILHPGNQLSEGTRVGQWEVMFQNGLEVAMTTPERVNDNVSLRNVLFATDFSAASMKALPYVTSIARRFDAKVCVAHVVPPEDYPSGLNSLDEAAQVARGEAELKMSGLLNSAPFRDLPCEGVVGNGDIWIGLSDLMRRNATDLLVMGTIGRTGARKFLLGSVAEEAIRESPCPVLTVGPESRRAEEVEFRNILYATDFSADSLAAAPYALAFAKHCGSRLTLVHVFEGLTESPYLDAQMAKLRLCELVSPVDLGPEPQVIVEMGSPANVILKAAEDTASDLILIGARGAGALPRLASHFGSVAHRIACRAGCPVLTARPLIDRDKEQ